MLIYKIFRSAEYSAFTNDGTTDGAPVDRMDGYIHFSTAEQVAETARRHFAGEGDLILLAVEAEGQTDLKWEVSRGGAAFPHLYRTLRSSDVLWAKPLPFSGGAHDFTGLL
ncbi:MAG: DUF952 domain-containing protein [Pseudomonadota bacterium]